MAGFSPSGTLDTTPRESSTTRHRVLFATTLSALALEPAAPKPVPSPPATPPPALGAARSPHPASNRSFTGNVRSANPRSIATRRASLSLGAVRKCCCAWCTFSMRTPAAPRERSAALPLPPPPPPPPPPLCCTRYPCIAAPCAIGANVSCSSSTNARISGAMSSARDSNAPRFTRMNEIARRATRARPRRRRRRPSRTCGAPRGDRPTEGSSGTVSPARLSRFAFVTPGESRTPRATRRRRSRRRFVSRARRGITPRTGALRSPPRSAATRSRSKTTRRRKKTKRRPRRAERCPSREETPPPTEGRSIRANVGVEFKDVRWS
eukprot:31483-Pelagococcus_subviridis.AAC.17